MKNLNKIFLATIFAGCYTENKPAYTQKVSESDIIGKWTQKQSIYNLNGKEVKELPNLCQEKSYLEIFKTGNQLQYRNPTYYGKNCSEVSGKQAENLELTQSNTLVFTKGMDIRDEKRISVNKTELIIYNKEDKNGDKKLEEVQIKYTKNN